MSTDRPLPPVSDAAPPPTPVTKERGDAYLDIVWRQFKKNRPASICLWLLLPVFLIAIFAPALASNQPFIYFDDDAVIFPWTRALFNPEVPIDFLFNMALLGFFPWVLIAFLANRYWKGRAVPARQRVINIIVGYLAIIVLLCVAFLTPNLNLRPTNPYWARQFIREEFVAKKSEDEPRKRGYYAIIPFGPLEVDLPSRFKPPGYRKPEELRQDMNDGTMHLLGTDNIGRDVLARMIYGTRLSISVGFVAVGIYITIGVALGAIAGYFGGATDVTISRIIEVVMLFPSFFLILTMVAMLGRSMFIVMFVIGITGWPTIARLTRGEVLKQRAIDYTAAARSLGASHMRIIFRHILPNAISPALVSAPFGIANAIVTEAGLSLLGFGVQPPAPSWGSLLQLALGNYGHWWLIVVPSLAIFFTVTVLNMVGSGMRDAMDPKLRI